MCTVHNITGKELLIYLDGCDCQEKTHVSVCDKYDNGVNSYGRCHVDDLLTDLGKFTRSDDRFYYFNRYDGFKYFTHIIRNYLKVRKMILFKCYEHLK